MVYGLMCFDKSTAAINGNTVQTKLSNKIPFKEALSKIKNSKMKLIKSNKAIVKLLHEEVLKLKMAKMIVIISISDFKAKNESFYKS